jgi:hypothetical protein
VELDEFSGIAVKPGTLLEKPRHPISYARSTNDELSYDSLNAVCKLDGILLSWLFATWEYLGDKFILKINLKKING